MKPDPNSNSQAKGSSTQDRVLSGPDSVIERVLEWFRHLRSDFGQEPTTPRIRWFVELIFPILLGTSLTVWIRLSGFDLHLQQYIFQAAGNSWATGELPFWKLLYRYGTLPAIFVGILGGIGLCLSFFRTTFRPWRQIFCFVYFTMLIGPGLIVNAGLKDTWGRPRPKDVLGLGGQYHFEPVLTFDRSSPGNSFPSGHAAMGFYFLGGFFIFRRHRKELARTLLIVGLLYGGVVGGARMLQGGHFLSDIIWAGLICYFTAMGAYYATGLDRHVLVTTRPKFGPIPRRVLVWGTPLLLVVLAGILLATPYRSKWEAPVGDLSLEEGSFDLRLILTVGDVEIVPSENFGISVDAKGQGLPTSRIKRSFLVNHKRDHPEVLYKEELRGWFSGLNSKVMIHLPWDRIRQLNVDVADADLRIVLADRVNSSVIEVTQGRGEVQVLPAGQSLTIENLAGNADIEQTIQSPALEKAGSEAGYRLKIGGGYSGRIKIGDTDSP